MKSLELTATHLFCLSFLPFAYMTAGNQRHGDPGADPQCTGAHDCDPTDFPPVEGQQHPLYEAEPPDLVAAVRPAGRIPAEPRGKKIK